MKTDNQNELNENPVAAIEAIAANMDHFRQEMEYFDAIGSRIAARTRFIMRAVFITLTVSSIYLVFMIFEMASNMSVMTTHLQDMYKNFGTMSDDMSAIAVTVNNMGESVSGMPVIAESTKQIDLDVFEIKDSISGVNQSIIAIDQDMITINANMLEMNARLHNMSRSVNLMTYDVREMSLPVNSGPLSDFWPR
jgi:hypothetical protein